MKSLILILLVVASGCSTPQKTEIYQIQPTKFEILDGSNLPKEKKVLTDLSVKAARGEYEPLSILIDPHQEYTNVKLNWSDFSGSATLPKNILDPYIVKVWWQAAVNTTINTGADTLVQELLIKNDRLLQVDYDKERSNRLLIEVNGQTQYADIGSVPPQLPDYYEIHDGKELLPFDMKDERKKQLWFIIHVPDDAPAGKYKTEMTITSDQGIIKKFSIELEVLPFVLEEPVLTYGMYYTAVVTSQPIPAKYLVGGLLKSEEQYELELRDMLAHGIKYPHNSNNAYSQDLAMSIRKRVGLPDDNIYLHAPGNAFQSCANGKLDYDKLEKTITDYINAFEALGYTKDRLFFYGYDEANTSRYRLEKGELTTLEKAVPLYKRIKDDLGIKIFQSISMYGENFNLGSEYIDLPILYGKCGPDDQSWCRNDKILAEIAKWHAKGKKVYAYSNPQAACENPEIYRRNHGILAWKEGWDGIMDWKYQSTQGHTWNDWDNQYRDPNFTYPITNGVISTIEWEGVREAFDDVRYLSTLLNRQAKLKEKGILDKDLDRFIYNIDPYEDLDSLRNKIIKKIIEIDSKYN